MDNKVIYAKFNRERLPQYQIATFHYMDREGFKFVKKSPLTPQAKKHIQNLYRNTHWLSQAYENIEVLTGELTDDGIVTDFVEGISWDEVLFRSLIDYDSKERFYELLGAFKKLVLGLQGHKIESFESSPEFVQVFGRRLSLENVICLQPANIDLIFDNVFYSEVGNSTLIDCEWVFPFKIPVPFILFRSIYAFWHKYEQHISKYVSYNDLLNAMDITSEFEEVFRNMEEEHFQQFVNGEWYKQGFFGQYLKPSYTLSTLQEEVTSGFYNVKLYLPVQTEYSEEYALSKVCSSHQTQVISFEFETTQLDMGRKFRLDPIDRPGLIKLCNVDIIDVSTNKVIGNYQVEDFHTSNEIITIEGSPSVSLLATDEDPQLFFKVDHGEKFGKLKVILHLSIDLNVSAHLKKITSQRDKHYKSIITRIEEEKNTQLEQMVKHHELELTSLSKEIQSLSDWARHLESEKERILSENILLSKEIGEYKRLNEELLNSTSWKVTSPLRFIVRKIRKK